MLGSEYLKIIDERKINTENIADYIMLSVDGFVDLVEIKRPGVSNFWQDKKDHANLIPSSDLIKAIVQCANYIEILENEANSINTRSRLGGAAISKPNCMLVFGRSNNWGEEEYKAFRLLNSTINKINIISYDMLLLRAKNLMGVNYIGENDE